MFVWKVFCILIFLSLVAAARKPTKKLEKPKPKPKPLKLNTDNLPTLAEILENLQLSSYLNSFVKMGVTETRLLLRLTSMDFRIMEIDWEGVTKEDINKLKDSIAAYIIQATVPDEVPQIDLKDRQKLIYGKIYIKNSVQGYEYTLASFGKPPPIGPQHLVMLPTEDGCEIPFDNVDYSQKTLLLRRGNCSFLEKAKIAKALNAAGMIVVNSEDRLESPSSGLGVDRNITEAMVAPVNDLFVVSTSNTTWSKLSKSLLFNEPAATHVSIVPLKCHTGGSCQPVIEEEKAVQAEVTWGGLRLESPSSGDTRNFEFLTSNFGNQLPDQQQTVSVVLADDILACESLVPHDKYHNAAVVVHRGGCRFDTKALNAQEAGARLVIVVDVEDNALQRLGGMQPLAGYVGVPSILVTAEAGKHIHKALDISGSLQAKFTAGVDNSVSDAWIDLSFTQWSADSSERLIQLESLVQKYSHVQGSVEIVPWLQRRIQEITVAKHAFVDKDEL